MTPDDSPDLSSHHESARDRLLSALVLVTGCAVMLALPFALQAGSEFFLPVAAAFVISLALAPLADWLVARGLPNFLASVSSLGAMILLLALAAGAVIQPAIALADTLPLVGQRLAARAEALSGVLGKLTRITDVVSRSLGHSNAREVVLAPRATVEDVLMQTPGVMLHVLMTLLLSYFMLAARQTMRRTLLLGRQEYDASLRVARVLRDVQNMMGVYFATTFLVSCSVGLLVGLGAWGFGWERPIMWGGLAALLNFLPYVGPLTMVVVLALFGLSGPSPSLWALVPAASYLGLHAIESNVVTPILMGRRLAISPVIILSGLIFFGWIWGLVGIFLAVPLLVVVSALLEHAGRPNVIGFLFGEPLFNQPAPAAEAVTGQPG